MIIDFHTHCFPDALAERVVPALAKEANIKAFCPGTVSGLCASMRHAGVDYSVMLQIATKPSQNHSVNTWAIERNESGIIPFGSVHPLGEDWSDELDRLATAGIKGIKLHPEYQQFYVDADFMLPIYTRIRELGFIVLFHAGIDVGIAPPVHGTPRHFANILDLLPKGRTVLAHMGGWKSWDDVENLLVGSHLLFDTSFSSEFMTQEQIRRMIENHGATQFLMGSDSPWADQAGTIDEIKQLGLSNADEQAILGGNAARILNLN